MFSGQGSQYFDMGRDLYDADPDFRELLRTCDSHCKRLLGYSLLAVIYPERKKPESEPFDNLLDSHPALFCIQYALAQTLLRRGMKPDLVLGYSLGEWVALAVAGALPFAEALESVINQAELLLRHTEPGAMLAIMAPSEIADASPVFRETPIAAFNFRKHFVVSGPRDAVHRVQAHVRHEGIPHQMLPVRVAFHSPLVDVVEQRYQDLVGQLRPRPLRFPLVSLAHSALFETLPEHFFWNVLRRPVRFEDGVRSLDAGGPYTFVDLGPSGTLATFFKYARDPESESVAYSILTPYQQALANLEHLESQL